MRQEDLVTETKTAAGFAVEPSVTPIPPTFSFSQSSLQAFEDCPRRFWLAYIEQLPWPAVEASPIQEHEELMRLGERFHRLVQRAEIGIDPDIVAAGLEPPLSTWFSAYLTHRPADLPSLSRQSEVAGEHDDAAPLRTGFEQSPGARSPRRIPVHEGLVENER